MAKDFILKVGDEYPERRMSVNDALNHPFITRKLVMKLKSSLTDVEKSAKLPTTSINEVSTTDNDNMDPGSCKLNQESSLSQLPKPTFKKEEKLFEDNIDSSEEEEEIMDPKKGLRLLMMALM